MSKNTKAFYSIAAGSAKFLRGVPTYEQLKPTRLPEIALIGRSNVGKSSFLNRIFSANSLARVSSTPGKTQEINIYSAELRAPDGESSSIVVADLPGFGFAKLSKKERERMGKLTAEYLYNRKELEVVVLLNDSKRLPEEEELALVKLAIKSNRSLIIALTKVDRLNQKEKAKAIKDISAAYELSPEQLLLTGKEIPTTQFWNSIGSRLWGA